MDAPKIGPAPAQCIQAEGRDPPDADFARWLAETRPLEAGLLAAEPASRFNPKRLQVAATRRLPG